MSSFIGSSFMPQRIFLQYHECDVLFSNFTPNNSFQFSTQVPLSALHTRNSSNPATPIEQIPASSSLSPTSVANMAVYIYSARPDRGDMFGADGSFRPLAYGNTLLGWGATAMLALGLLTCALAAAFVFLARAHPLVRACSYGLTLATLSGTAIELLVISMWVGNSIIQIRIKLNFRLIIW